MLGGTSDYHLYRMNQTALTIYIDVSFTIEVPGIDIFGG